MTKVLLQDVAREANTSVATVSRVLNGRSLDRIPPPTRQRVQATADRLGYTVNHVARAMRTKRTMVIGVSVQDISAVNTAQLVEQIEYQSSEAGFEVLLGIERGRPLVELQRLRDRQVDGLILIRGAHIHDPDRVIDRLATDRFPMVCLGPQPHADVPALDWDRRAAARDAAAALIERGARRFLLIGNEPSGGMDQRRQGLLDAAEAGGVQLHTAYLADFESSQRPRHRPILEPLVELLRTHRPDAVFTQSEAHAWPTLAAAKRLELAVPGDLKLAALTCADHAMWHDPPLTDLRIDYRRLAELALQRLRTIIAAGGPDEAPDTHRVQATVAWRTSTAASSEPDADPEPGD